METNYFKIFLTVLLFLVSTVISYLVISKDKKTDYKKLCFISLIPIIGSLFLDLSLLDILYFSALHISFLSDMYTGEVYSIPLYSLIFISLINFYKMPSYISLIFMILIYIYKKTPKMQFYFGEGDLWILLSLSMMYSNLVFYTLFYSSVIALLYALILRKKEVYFIPFIYIALFISKIGIFNRFLFVRI